MSKIFFVFIVSLLLINCKRINKVNVKANNEVTLKDKTACVCFKLNDDTKTDKSFYLNAYSKDKGARMDKTLYYKYLDICNSDDYCEDDSYIDFNKNDDIISETEDSDGFSFEYEFNLDDNKHRALIMQYKDFTGKELKMKFTSYIESKTVLIIIIVIGAVFALSTFVLIVVVICQKRKLDDMRKKINKINFVVNTKEEDLENDLLE